MNKDECLNVLKSALEIDQILVEQHLGLKWQAPVIPDEYIQKLSEKRELLRTDTSSGQSPSSFDQLKLFKPFYFMIRFFFR